ncbi:MAG: hypothetical protein ACFCVG_02560 [Kineosporiaceae bacterium]
MNLAPVADVVPAGTANRPIGDHRRHFGDDPAVTGAAVTAMSAAWPSGWWKTTPARASHSSSTRPQGTAGREEFRALARLRRSKARRRYCMLSR